MLRLIRLSFFASALVLILVSCNQDPTSVGADLIPDQDKIEFKEIDSYQTNIPQKSSYFENKMLLGAASQLLLGKNSYSESSILFRYSIFLPDSLLTRFKNGELIVSNAWMEMIPRYALGDKSANFDFSVHQIRSGWGLIKFDRDSLSQLRYDAVDVSSGLVVRDTLVKFNLKPEVVYEWLKYKVDTNATKNYGIILKPKPAAQRYLGFKAVQASSQTNETRLKIVIERLPSFKDTLDVSPFMDIHSLTATLPQADNDLYLQGSFSLRGNLFFDISAIPKDIIINKTTLELTIDTLKTTDGLPKSDSLMIQMLADSTTRKVTSDNFTSILQRKGNIFTGDITWMVQRWLKGEPQFPNHGALLTLLDEDISAARIAFYGSRSADKTVRPKLKIVYMKKL